MFCNIFALAWYLLLPKMTHSEQLVHFMTAAFVLQPWQSLYDCFKKGCKNESGHMVTHSITVMTDDRNRPLRL